MTGIAELVDGLGGYARKRELVAAGARDHQLTRAVRSGDVLRARNGWYSTAPDTDAAFMAIRVGGRLTGYSALAREGAWLRARGPLTVAVPPNAARLRSPRSRRIGLTRRRKHGVVLHWETAESRRRGTRTSTSIEDSIVAFLPGAPFEEAVAVLDWACHTGRLDPDALDRVLARSPRRLAGIGSWIDPTCESFPESIARTRFRIRGFQVTTQVPVGDRERIDLLIDGEIAVEVDGEQFHRDRFARDRAKDLRMTLAGYHAIRVTVPLIAHSWLDIVAAVDTALAARGKARCPAGGRRPRSTPLPARSTPAPAAFLSRPLPG